MLTRHVGRVVAAGIVCSGIAVAVARPSSAKPRNACLDEAHWWAQLSQLTTSASVDWDAYQSWQDAEIHPNEDGTSYYVVHFTNGNTVAGTRLDDIPEQGNLWYGRWTTASNAALDFYDNMAMCTL